MAAYLAKGLRRPEFILAASVYVLYLDPENCSVLRGTLPLHLGLLTAFSPAHRQG